MNNYSQYKDEQLLTLLKEGSPICDRVFNTIYSRYSSKLNSYCLFRCSNQMDAEEIFEDTWMKFLNSVRAGKKVNKILPYLFAIARNLSIDKYRQQNAKKNISIDYKDINDLDNLVNHYEFLSDLENDDLISLVKMAVNNLDDIYKEVFVLRWFGDMTYKEISTIVDSNMPTVKMRCIRAMHKVRTMLKPYFIEINN